MHTCQTGPESWALRAAMAALVLTSALLAIYPEGHWDRVTKGTAEALPGLISSSIADDKTLFVRFIASEG